MTSEPFLCKKGRRADGSHRYAIVIRKEGKQRTLATLPPLNALVKLLRPEDNEGKVTSVNEGTHKEKFGYALLTEHEDDEKTETPERKFNDDEKKMLTEKEKRILLEISR